MKRIPTYIECVKLTQNKDCFYENKYIINGFGISLFNYRLASYIDFIDPVTNNKELRGLCFVFNTDGTVFNRYLLLEKFFNLDQTEESLYENIKDYTIKYVNNKEDGSVASFIRLPNGDVIGKSKMGFDSDQAHGINKIYNNNEGVKTIVDYFLDNDIVAVFEYVAPTNRIVLKYSEEKLILLKLRDNKTGKYLDIHDYLELLNTNNIEYAEFESISSLDALIKKNETDENKEGYVIHAIDENGHDFFYKIKNEWYRSRHGLLTDEIRRENMIIKYILDDTIDDLLGEIPKDEVETIEKINSIISIVRTELNTIEKGVNELHTVLEEMGSVRDFAIKYNKDPLFAGVMAKNNYGNDPFDYAIETVGKQTNFLEIARKWLIKRGYEYS